MSAHSHDDVIPLEKPAAPRSPGQGVRGAAPARSATSQAGPELRCPSCAYSMKGLRTLRCPECGKAISASALGKAQDAGVDTQRKELRQLTLMLLVGLAGSLGLMLFQHGWQGAAGYLLIFAISVPAGLAAYFICCLLWVGFDEPLPIVAYKLAAIYAIVDLLSFGISFVPILNVSMVRIAIVGLTYIGLLMTQLDLDSRDAVGVAIATFIMKVIVGAVVLSVLVSAFGLTI